MSKKVEIICDGCGKDLTYADDSKGYYIAVSSKAKSCRTDAPQGIIIAAVAAKITPPIDREHHFCDIECLDRWRTYGLP